MTGQVKCDLLIQVTVL